MEPDLESEKEHLHQTRKRISTRRRVVRPNDNEVSRFVVPARVLGPG